MFVYSICNKVNGKKYIGITTRCISIRWNEHKKSANTNKQAAIHKAIRKYGEEAFEVSQLDIADSIEELNKKETFWIDHEKSMTNQWGYNQKMGGDQPFLDDITKQKISKKAIGRKLSEETKKQISESSLNRWQNSEYKKKIVSSCTIAQNKPDQIAKIIQSSKRMWESPEFRAKMHLIKAGKPQTEEQIHNARIGTMAAKAKPFELWKVSTVKKGSNAPKMLVYEQLVGVWDNPVTCEMETGVSQGAIASIFHGSKKTTKGYSCVRKQSLTR